VRAGAPPAAPPPGHPPPAPAAPVVPEPVPGFKPSLQAVQDAQKAAKYAVSSLSFDDIAGATKYLADALRLLTQPPAGGK
jgi:vacuolar protein sorting-associated protein VTA1